MKIGVYLLKFEGTDKVYVGQSIDIDRRYTVHLRKLRQGTGNSKMQKAYLEFGKPLLEILCLCDRSLLNTKEKEYFDKYDSVNNGLNIASEPSIHLEGPENGASKYTEEQILQVFNLLLNVTNLYKDIESITGVSLSTVRHISNGESHTWLSVEYPDKYRLLESLRGGTRSIYSNSSKAKGTIFPTILSPDNIEYTVEIISTFAKEHGLDSSCLSKVLRKVPKYNSHKGWKLK